MTTGLTSAQRRWGSLAGGLVAACCTTWWMARSGRFDGNGGRMLAAALVALLYLVFCSVIFLQHRRRQLVAQQSLSAVDVTHADTILIVFASQTGFAEQLAWQSAQALQAGGIAVRVMALAQLDLAQLREAHRILFVVSTTGEGDAPDSAAGFARKVMRNADAAPGSIDLSRMAYGLLALGDSSYVHYCAFGRAVETWLRHQGASALFDSVEVDNGDEGALRHWQHHLGMLSGHTDMADWSAPQYGAWTLRERRLLNPGSLGGPAFHLAFEVPAGSQWQAGDIAEIGPCQPPHKVAAILDALGLDAAALVPRDTSDNADSGEESLAQRLARSMLPTDEDGVSAWRGVSPRALAALLQPLPHREYSIASVPQEGRLELLVRRMQHPDGSAGLGSGWLTEYAGLDTAVALRVRENRSFHAPAGDRPLILIGNGTGLAGLRAHLKARAVAGHHRNWLLFGERSAAHDFFHQQEIEGWQRQGILQRLDLAFSRDQEQRIYVQDKLLAAADELRAWVAADAAIYVCGSLASMAAGVTRALTAIVGSETLETMAEQGRYRRDVY